jgi:hypothetical protein
MIFGVQDDATRFVKREASLAMYVLLPWSDPNMSEARNTIHLTQPLFERAVCARLRYRYAKLLYGLLRSVFVCAVHAGVIGISIFCTGAFDTF